VPSFSTPSRIPRMKDSTLTKTLSTFAPVNLFSVAAVFSSTTSPPQAGYNFTFVHEGRQQLAVLDKTFLTGLEKDNVRITWEQATRELLLGCEVRVDVTQLKRKSFDEKWLVFGLYVYTVFCSGDLSSKDLAGICPDSCHLNSDGDLVKSKENMFNGENLNSRTLRSAFCAKIDLLEDSLRVQEVVSSTFKKTNVDASLVDVEDFSDVSFGSVSDSGESSDKFSMLVNPDLATSHMEEVSVNEGIELPNEGIYFDSLVWRTGIPTDASVIEAQFEKVLEENGLLENYNHLAKAFDQIFEDYLNNTQFVVSTSPPGNTVLNITNSVESEISPSSSLILGSQPSQDSEKDISVRTGPALASTPSEKCGGGDHSLPGFGLEGTEKFTPVKMDSGYYETFSSGSLLEISSESDESINPAVKNLAMLPSSGTGGVFRHFLIFSVKQIIYELASFI